MKHVNNAAATANEETLLFDSHIAGLVVSAVASAAPQSVLAKATKGNTASLIGLGRAIAQHEGYLIQHAIAGLLSAREDRVSLSNVRVPVLDAALDLVAMNRSGTYTQIALDSEAKSRKSYAADIILVDKARRHAWLIDVKRSLAGYESKLQDLLSRMQAAGIVIPDLLWREHHRLAVDSVGVSVIDASSERHKPESGIWALTEIDTLFDLPGLAEQCRQVIECYRNAVQRAWQIELDRPRMDIKIHEPRSAPADEIKDPRKDHSDSLEPVRRLSPIHIGLAKPRTQSPLAR